MSQGSSTHQETKRTRLEHPSGWLYLTRHESVPLLVDALLDWPPEREFTVTEFAEHTGVVRQTVSRHLDVLIDVGLVERVSETRPRRYRINDGPVTTELFELNGAINAAGIED